MSFKVVTVSSGRPAADYYCYDQFFQSIARYNHTPLLIQPEVWGGLGSKPKMLLTAIEGGHIPESHIIFADSWDLVFAAPPEDIMESFKSFDAPFVCSAEKNCFPSDLKDQFPDGGTSYRYLNSGFIVAEKEALHEILKKMCSENILEDYYNDQGHAVHINDQFLFQQAFVAQPVKMVLDYEQKLSQTMCQVEESELDFSTQRIKNMETGKYPMTFHFNGPSKTFGLMQPVLNKLGL